MSATEKNETLKSILRKAAEKGIRLRFFGPSMVILAEGKIAYVGNGIVAIKHRDDAEPDEYLAISSIIKVQKIENQRY